MPVTVKVQIIQKNIDLMLDKVLSEGALRVRADRVLAEINRTAPVADGTHSFPDRGGGGRLRDSFKIGFTTDHGKRVIRIFSDAVNSRGQPYAKFVTNGTRPHVINGNPDLAFQWISRGVFVIAPQVHHPGTAPNDFVRRALRKF